MRAALLLIVSICLSGCFEKKIDASSQETMKASISEITASLSEADKKVFGDNLALIAMKDVSLADVMKSGASGIAANLEKAQQSLNGKTVAEVNAMAATIRAERAQREREQAVVEIAELQAKQASAEKAKQELQKFKINRSRFYQEPQKYLSTNKAIIELDVVNGTGMPISRAYFKGTIASPGRTIPWLSDTFNYEISGGLEPGEAASWALAPNMFSDWGKVDAPADAIFTVEVYKLDGADGKTLFSSEGLSKRDADRLESLQKQYGL